MAGGRPRKPDAVKKMNGTLQPCRANGEISALVPLTDVKPPSWLTSTGKRIFKEKARQLISIGILTSLDIDALAMYSNSYAEAINSITEIEKSGRMATTYNDEGVIIGFTANPFYKIYNDNLKVINQIGAQFGFSPTTRASLAASMPKKQDTDDFDDFFRV